MKKELKNRSLELLDDLSNMTEYEIRSFALKEEDVATVYMIIEYKRGKKIGSDTCYDTKFMELFSTLPYEIIELFAIDKISTNLVQKIVAYKHFKEKNNIRNNVRLMEILEDLSKLPEWEIKSFALKEEDVATVKMMLEYKRSKEKVQNYIPYYDVQNHLRVKYKLKSSNRGISMISRVLESKTQNKQQEKVLILNK